MQDINIEDVVDGNSQHDVRNDALDRSYISNNDGASTLAAQI